MSLSSSIAICGMPPRPVEANTSLPGCAFAKRDELGQRLGRHLLVDHEDFRHRHDLRDERQVLERVERHVVAQVDVHRKPARWRDGDGVAVGIRLGDRGDAGQCRRRRRGSRSRWSGRAMLAIFSVRMRLMVSAGPPAGNGTTNLMVRFGNSWAARTPGHDKDTDQAQDAR